MAARTAVRIASARARRMLAAARRRTPHWQALGVLACCAILLAGAVVGLREAGAGRAAPQHTTSRVRPARLADSGPPPGLLLPAWKVTTNLAGQPAPPGQVSYGLVDGQLVVVSSTGLDVRDGRTGSPRWHYFQPDGILAGWTDTGTEIAAYFEHTAGRGSHLLVALDAATGQQLWQSRVDRPIGAEQYSLRWPSGPGVFLVTRNGRTLMAARSRTGTTAWSRTLPDGCSPSAPAPYSSGGDQSLAVFTAGCRSGQQVLAMNPADGVLRWSLSPAGGGNAAIMVQHGISAVWDGSTLHVVRGDGRSLLTATGDALCGDVCQIAVSSGRVLVSYSPNGAAQVLRAVNIGSATPAWQQPSSGYQSMTGSGGWVYALRGPLANGLLPAAVDVIDPASGQFTTVALPLAFRAGTGNQPWLAAAGGLLLTGYPLAFEGQAGGSRLVALRSAPPGWGPASLGGVAPSQWPNACRLVTQQDLAAAIPAVTFSWQAAGQRQAGLPFPVSCQYQPSQPSQGAQSGGVLISVSWVAQTGQQASSLLGNVLASYPDADPLPQVGDEAYDLGALDGPVMVRVGRAIATVQADQDPGAATQLARAAAVRLRLDGF
jgi:outer membrane protein assembly factor BamB